MANTDETRVSVWNGIKLCVWRWTPSESVKALMYVAHGTWGHMGRFEKLSQNLIQNGVLVFGHDHVGHGKSGGERMYIEDFNTYILDVINHVKDMKSSYPGIPCFLMGHSMGGLIAILVAIKEQYLFDGIILSTAAVKANSQFVGAAIIFIAKVLGFLVPHFKMKVLDPSLISSIPNEVDMYKEDPLVYHGPATAKLISEGLNTLKVAQSGLSTINVPTLLLHGTNDNIIPFEASEYIFRSITSKDKQFESFEGSHHEVLHDKEQERAFNVIKDWIIRIIAQK